MDKMIIYIGDKKIIAEGEVRVTYASNKEYTYSPEKVSQLYLNEINVVDIQIARVPQ